MSLKNVRLQRKLSQSQLAEKSNVNLKTIQAYEQDVKNINNAHLEILLKLSIALDCKIENIITSEYIKNLLEKYRKKIQNKVEVSGKGYIINERR